MWRYVEEKDHENPARCEVSEVLIILLKFLILLVDHVFSREGEKIDHEVSCNISFLSATTCKISFYVNC
jgi:hypothetical protein